MPSRPFSSFTTAALAAAFTLGAHSAPVSARRAMPSSAFRGLAGLFHALQSSRVRSGALGSFYFACGKPVVLGVKVGAIVARRTATEWLSCPVCVRPRRNPAAAAGSFPASTRARVTVAARARSPAHAGGVQQRRVSQ